LGIKSIPIGFVGGVTGRFVTDDLLDKYRMKSSFVLIDDVTRVNMKLNNDGVETEINGLGPVVTEIEMKQLLDFIQELSTQDILVIGGSPTLGAASSYIELVKLCNQRNIEFIIDTNQTSLVETLSYKPLLIKPNLKELCDVFYVEIQTEEDVIKYARKLLQKGAQNVLVSLGKDGSIFVNNDVVYKATPIIGNVQNTVGAGDSMVAGFIKAYVEKKNILEQFKTAVAAGTATAFSTGLANKIDVEIILKKVEIEMITYETNIT